MVGGWDGRRLATRGGSNFLHTGHLGNNTLKLRNCNEIFINSFRTSALPVDCQVRLAEHRTAAYRHEDGPLRSFRTIDANPLGVNGFGI
jgi:hypothetical protein